VIPVVVVAAVAGIIYYRRKKGYAGFFPFRNGPQPITAIHPDDDDDKEVEVGTIN